MKNSTNHSHNLKTSKWLFPSVMVLASFSTLTLAGCGHEDEQHVDAHHASEHAPELATESHADSDTEQHSNVQMQDVILATVVSVYQDSRQLVLDHEALPTIGMDAMTMGFAVSDSVNLNTLQAGDRVRVMVSMQPGTGLQITRINKVR